MITHSLPNNSANNETYDFTMLKFLVLARFCALAYEHLPDIIIGPSIIKWAWWAWALYTHQCIYKWLRLQIKASCYSNIKQFYH